MISRGKRRHWGMPASSPAVFERPVREISMKYQGKLIAIFIVVIVTALMAESCLPGGEKAEHGQLAKKHIKIAVTDSGLGGLSVMEDIAARISGSGYYASAELVFVNALFDASSGYNAILSREEKVRVFGQVLAAIESKVAPDAIVVACNTLSVLIDDTGFRESSDTPVYGIINPGVDLIYNTLMADSSSVVLIFGTETTIEEGTHKRLLLERGIAADRIITQACPQLQSFIEAGPEGEDTGMLIAFYVSEALSSVEIDSAKVYISLNCSHYGYSTKLWEKALMESAFLPGGVLNPNNMMADKLIRKAMRTKETDISYSVITKVPLDKNLLLFDLVALRSAALAEALMNYSLEPDLF